MNSHSSFPNPAPSLLFTENSILLIHELGHSTSRHQRPLHLLQGVPDSAAPDFVPWETRGWDDQAAGRLRGAAKAVWLAYSLHVSGWRDWLDIPGRGWGSMNRDAELCFLFERHDRERKFCIVKKNAPINTFFTAGISVTIILCISMNTVHKSFILLVFVQRSNFMETNCMANIYC